MMIAKRDWMMIGVDREQKNRRTMINIDNQRKNEKYLILVLLEKK